MISNIKILVVCGIIAFGGGAVVGYRAKSPEIKTITKEIVTERAVTRVRTVKTPDGTVTIEKIKVEDKESDKDIKIIQPVDLPTSSISRWHVSVDASTEVGGVRPNYGVQVERRVLGPLTLGVRATSSKTIGVVIGISF